MKKKRQAASPNLQAAPPTPPAASMNRTLLIFSGLFALALYANTLGHEFTVDDDMVVKKNALTQQGLSAIPEILSTPYRAGFHEREESLYRPLSVVCFAILYEWAGDHPFPYHLLNVILFAVTAGLLYATLKKLLKDKNAVFPILITCLFIAHPIHTEVVANIKSLDEILAFIFSLLMIRSALNYCSDSRMALLGGLSLAFLMALLSKESAVTLLAVIPLCLYFYAKPNRKQWTGIATALLVPFAVYLVLRFQALKGATNFDEIQVINNSLAAAGDDVMLRISTAIYIIGRYLLLLFFPHPLSYDYSYHSIPLVSFGEPGVLFSLIILSALALFAFRGLRKKDPVAFGILFSGITVSVVSNLVILIESTMAERFLYQPSLGFCFSLVFVVARLTKTTLDPVAYPHAAMCYSKNKSIIWITGIILLLYSVKTITRNQHWKDNFTLLSHDVKTNPQSARIRYSLGSTYIFELAEAEKNPERKKEWYREGILQLEKGVAILDYYGDAWLYLGHAWNQLEDYTKAAVCFDKGMEHTIQPKENQLTGAGIAYGEIGQFKKSFEMFRRELAANDTAFDALNNLGMFMSKRKQYDSAEYYLQKALEVRPNSAKAMYNLGNCYAYQEQFARAIEWYQKALSVDPGYSEAHVNMGNSYAALQQYEEALKAFEAALALNASNSEARNNMGVTYLLLGDSAAARKYLPVP